MSTSEAPVSVFIFTLNEEIHLEACLDSVSWSDDVIVIDSYSSDDTLAICERRGIPVRQNEFAGFGQQRNWALEHVPTRHEWILILDADERVPSEMVHELRETLAKARPDVAAYRIRRRFYMWNRWLKYSGLYPSWVVRLVRRNHVSFVDRGHAETQLVRGTTNQLHSDLIDENLKGIDEWFERQNRYSRRDAEQELLDVNETSSLHNCFNADPLMRRTALKALARRLPARGFAYFLYSYVFRLGFLEGRDGLMLCLMRSIYQTMVEIKKHDRRRSSDLRNVGQ